MRLRDRGLRGQGIAAGVVCEGVLVTKREVAVCALAGALCHNCESMHVAWQQADASSQRGSCFHED